VWFGIQQSVADQATYQWRVCLDICVKAKGKHFEHMLWGAMSTIVNNLLWNFHSVFCFTTLEFWPVMIFKILTMVVEQFWYVHWISCCNKILVHQRWHFYTVLLQIHSGNCLQKIDILDLSLINLLQNQQRCNFVCLTVYKDLPFTTSTFSHHASRCRIISSKRHLHVPLTIMRF